MSMLTTSCIGYPARTQIDTVRNCENAYFCDSMNFEMLKITFVKSNRTSPASSFCVFEL